MEITKKKLSDKDKEVIKDVIYWATSSSLLGKEFLDEFGNRFKLRNNIYQKIIEIFENLPENEGLIIAPTYIWNFISVALADSLESLESELETITSYSRKEVDEVLTKINNS